MTKPVSYRPVEGRRALWPSGAPLSDEGEAFDLTPYWRRLLADGDIEPVPAAKSRTRQTSKTSKGSKPE